MNKQNKIYMTRVGRLLRLKSVSIAALLFVLAVPLFSPQSVMAQTPCTVNGFTITCTGDTLGDTDVVDSLKSLPDPEDSKVTINFVNANLADEIDFTGIVTTKDTAQLDIGQVGIGNNVRIRDDLTFSGSTMIITNGLGENQHFYFAKGKTISGLSTLTKKGDGYARFAGDVDSSGSTTPALNLEKGLLVIGGHINLGTSGVVTIHDSSKLAFEIDGNGAAGQITAGTMQFESTESGDYSVYVQWEDGITVSNDAKASLSGPPHLLIVETVQSVSITTTGSTTTITSPQTIPKLAVISVDSDGENQVGTIDTSSGGTSTRTVAWGDNDAQTAEAAIELIGPLSNLIAKLNEPDSSDSDSDESDSSATSSGDDDNNDAILGLGLVAILVAMFWGDGLFGSSFADDYAFNSPQSAYIASVDERSTLTLRETGNQPYQVWIRTGLEDTMQLAGVKNAGVSGTEIGLSLYRSDDFYIEASSAQDVAAQVSSLNQSAHGEVYALSSGWQNERYFAGVKLSYGDFDTDTVIDNPVVKSTLISQSEVRHTQAQFTAGTRWNTGNLLFTPSASVQAGTFDYSAHQAQGAVVNADVPAYTQDYSALRLGLRMSASDWLSFSDDVKWKPHLQFDQIHTNSGKGGDVTLRQMDRLGALSFNSGASVQAMPEVVNAVSFGTSVKTSKSSQSEWKFGYAGLEADGEYYHAAVAAYQMRF